MTFSPLMVALIVLVALASSLAGGLAVHLVWKFISHNNSRIRELEIRLSAEEEKRRAIEQVKGLHQHYTYNLKAGLYDVMALLVENKINREAEQARDNTAMSILQVLRKEPSSYDPEKPCGPRPGASL